MAYEDIAEALKAKGLKLTPQRLEIMRTLLDIGEDHPSLNRIHDSIRERMPTLSFSTLYNTISIFERNGLIKLFDFDGETRIEMKKENHVNLIDSRTGEIMDVCDEELVRKIISELDKDRIKDRDIIVNILMY